MTNVSQLYYAILVCILQKNVDLHIHTINQQSTFHHFGTNYARIYRSPRNVVSLERFEFSAVCKSSSDYQLELMSDTEINLVHGVWATQIYIVEKKLLR